MSLILSLHSQPKTFVFSNFLKLQNGWLNCYSRAALAPGGPTFFSVQVTVTGPLVLLRFVTVIQGFQGEILGTIVGCTRNNTNACLVISNNSTKKVQSTPSRFSRIPSQDPWQYLVEHIPLILRPNHVVLTPGVHPTPPSSGAWRCPLPLIKIQHLFTCHIEGSEGGYSQRNGAARIGTGTGGFFSFALKRIGAWGCVIYMD